MEIATAFGLAMTGPGARRFRIADCRFAIDGDCHGLQNRPRNDRSGGKKISDCGLQICD